MLTLFMTGLCLLIKLLQASKYRNKKKTKNEAMMIHGKLNRMS